jgi:hypothetical protein
MTLINRFKFTKTDLIDALISVSFAVFVEVACVALLDWYCQTSLWRKGFSFWLMSGLFGVGMACFFNNLRQFLKSTTDFPGFPDAPDAKVSLAMLLLTVVLYMSFAAKTIERDLAASAPLSQQVASADARKFATDLATHLIGLPADKGLSTRLYFEAPVAPGAPAAAACEFTLKNGNSVTTSAIDHKTACAQAALQVRELCVAGKC